jgi:hypothetical protein
MSIYSECFYATSFYCGLSLKILGQPESDLISTVVFLELLFRSCQVLKMSSVIRDQFCVNINQLSRHPYFAFDVFLCLWMQIEFFRCLVSIRRKTQIRIPTSSTLQLQTLSSVILIFSPKQNKRTTT